jgi:hypothetical protein
MYRDHTTGYFHESRGSGSSVHMYNAMLETLHKSL